MASVMNIFFIDNIRAEFPLLEANLPCYPFLSMDSIMPICTTTLYHFDRVTDHELSKIIASMNNTTCSSDPFPTRLLMSHICNCTHSTAHCKFMFDHGGFSYFL